MHKAKLLLIFIFSIYIIYSCSSDEEKCPDEALPLLNINVIHADTIPFDSLYIYGELLNNDFYTGTSAPDCVLIPLNLTSDTLLLNFEMVYITDSVLILEDSVLLPFTQISPNTTYRIIDNVVFKYSRNIKLNNLECGFINEFDIDTNSYFTNQFVDSVKILDTLINSVDKTHATIYF